MRTADKIGAIFYGLWGLVHIIGGISLLQAVQRGGGQGFLESFIASGTINSAAAETIFAYHAYNLTWIGLMVLTVAVLLNWRQRPLGYWMNMALAGLVDLGLVVFMVVPGTISLTEAMIGISLFAVALVASTVARLSPRAEALRGGTD